MRIRVTFWRIAGASALSLLFVLQSLARIGHESPGATIFRVGFALLMTAYCFGGAERRGGADVAGGRLTGVASKYRSPSHVMARALAAL
jgi:hypothetical protein